MKLEVLFAESPAAVKLKFTKAEKKQFADVLAMCVSIDKWMRPTDTPLADHATAGSVALTAISDGHMMEVADAD